MSESAPANGIFLPSIETPTLTKAELSELLFERIGLNKRESRTWLKLFSIWFTRLWWKAKM